MGAELLDGREKEKQRDGRGECHGMAATAIGDKYSRQWIGPTEAREGGDCVFCLPGCCWLLHSAFQQGVDEG
jgi:hypothetical protein